MAKARLQYLTDTDRQFIHEQTLRVLSEVGVAYNTPTLTNLLIDAGATVDPETLTAGCPGSSSSAVWRWSPALCCSPAATRLTTVGWARTA